jgi:peptide/nickel transport system substrate-binding protein
MAMSKLVATGIASIFFALPAHSEQVLRIAMTASDIPTTTGMPNNGLVFV